MLTNTDIHNAGSRNIIQQTTGIYPLTATGISLYYHSKIDTIICRKGGVTSNLLTEKPEIKLFDGYGLKTINLSECYTCGILEAAHKKVLPAVIICTPGYEHLHDLINELADVALELSGLDLLKHYAKLSRFYFPTIILASNGIIYDETIYHLQLKLQERGINEGITRNICSKVVRASLMQGARREGSNYYPHKKGLIKIAVPRYELFMPVVELLNSKSITFSVHTNPRRIEFEKAIVNIATNSIAMVFALDKKEFRLRRINLEEALSPKDATHNRFVKELQHAVFEIGKCAGAFSASESFEKVWLPRKEQILKHDSEHISSSLHCFRNMIQTRNFPEKLPAKEHALIHPLKGFAQHYNLNNYVLLLAELEQLIINNIHFVRQNADKMTAGF
jgi:hypothetical protein